MGSVDARVTSADCPVCGDHMRQSRFVQWCNCGTLMSNNYGVYVDAP